MKKKYIKPVINFIQLDNEISLILESAVPPDGPDEVYNMLDINSEFNSRA